MNTPQMLPDTEHVKFQTLSEATVASGTFKGEYHLITGVYAAVVAWMEANGYVCDGPMFNIYHISPYETQNPDEFVTEVCYPVKKKSSENLRCDVIAQLHPSQNTGWVFFLQNHLTTERLVGII